MRAFFILFVSVYSQTISTTVRDRRAVRDRRCGIRQQVAAISDLENGDDTSSIT